MYYGDKLNKKKEGVMRLAFWNIHSFPRKEGYRMDQMKEVLQKSEADIIGLAETNTYWPAVTEAKRLDERTYEWWHEKEIIESYNRHNCKQEYQPGGVAMITTDRTVGRKMNMGSDAMGLGRWAWILYRGKNDVKVRVITIYNPRKSSKPGVITTYTQQKQYLRQADIQDCPKKRLVKDMKSCIKQWLRNGEQLIIMLDANEDVTDKNNNGLCKMLRQMGMIEAITKQHGIPAPKTHAQGSKPIDGIFITPAICIERAGYDKFRQDITDHRMIWMDVEIDEIFGRLIHKVVRPKVRKLKTGEPKTMEKFIESAENHCNDNLLLKKVLQLNSEIGSTISLEQRKKLEEIDEVFIEGVLKAEEKCRHIYLGQVSFSPDYKMLKNRCRFWRLVIRRKEKKKVHMRTIIRLQKKCKIKGKPTRWEKGKILDNLRQSNKEYNEFKPTADRRRQTWLDELAEDRRKKKKTKKASEIKKIKELEQVRKAYRRIRRVNGKAKNMGLSMVIVTENGVEREISEKEELEEVVMQENKTKFTQCGNTSFYREPLRTDFDQECTSEAFDEVLEGNYEIPEGTDKYAAILIEYMKRHPGVKELSPVLDLDEYRQEWNKSKETTSSGMSGLHFGHIIAMSRESRRMSMILMTMANIALRTGYSLNRWLKSLNVMLLKKLGVHNVDKLRTIQLYEGDFNKSQKTMARRTMEQAESLKAIAPDQYGGRKQLQAIAQALNKRLTFDEIRQRKVPAILLSNDAKACYDRIVHPVIMMALRRLGVPKKAVHSFIGTFQKMKHYLRTTFGDTDQWFSCENDVIKFNGAGQGNGFSPAIWAAVSTVLLKILREEGYGSTLLSALTQEALVLVGFAFVDDNDLVKVGKVDDTIEEITEDMQQMLNTWQGTLSATGGALVPEKSWFTPIDFYWIDGHWEYKRKEDINAEIEMQDTNFDTKELKSLEVYDAAEMLGVYLAADGNNDEQVEELREKGEKWADQLRAGYMNRYEAWLSLTTTIMKGIEYPLPALTLTEEECKYIMAPILKSGLQNSGICSNMARTLVYGDRKFQGLHLKNPYIKGGIDKLHMWMTHRHRGTLTDKLLQVTYEGLQLEVGTEKSYLAYKYKRFKEAVTYSWHTAVWAFNCEQSITINSDLPGIKTMREKDRCLMDLFYENANISPSQLAACNRCRKYIQVNTLAEIVTGDGKRLRKSVLQLTLDKQIPNEYVWPAQNKPSYYDQEIWRRCLVTLFEQQDEQYVLREKLGKWKEWTRYKRWGWMYSPQTKKIYHKQGEQWRVYEQRARITRRSRMLYYKTRVMTNELPNESKVCTVHQRQYNVMITGFTGYESTKEAEERTDGESEEVSDLQKYMEQNKLEWITNNKYNRWPTDNGNEIALAIKEERAVAMSDGSYYNGNGSCAWIIKGGASKWMSGHPVSRPSKEEADPYRSELMGVLSVLLAIECICVTHQVTKGTILLCCDGKSALNDSKNENLQSSHQKHHWDILSVIVQVRQRMKIGIIFHHVKGHQDREKPMEKLDLLARMNILVDEKAKDILKMEFKDKQWYPQYTLPRLQQWEIRHRGKLIIHPLQSHLYENISENKMRRYYREKGWLTDRTFHLIDWNNQRIALERQTITRRHWITKFISNTFGVGIMMKKWKKRDTAQCPHCTYEEEDNIHVIKCRSKIATEKWEELIDKFVMFMLERKAQPEVVQAISTFLDSWRNETKTPDIYHYRDELQMALAEQSRIGWDNFIMGRVSQRWKTVFVKMYSNYRTKQVTTSKVIEQMYEILFQMWELRNSVLHNKQLIHPILGEEKLNNEIIEQINLGKEDLLPNDYHLVNTEPHKILKRSITEKKEWLSTIQAARICKKPERYRNMNYERRGLRRFLNKNKENRNRLSKKNC